MKHHCKKCGKKHHSLIYLGYPKYSRVCDCCGNDNMMLIIGEDYPPWNWFICDKCGMEVIEKKWKDEWVELIPLQSSKA